MTVHDPLASPKPSKRAKSASALDLRYGRQGGRRLPTQSELEQAATFKAALDAGLIVAAECFCTRWHLAPCDVGKPCGHCGEPMVAT